MCRRMKIRQTRTSLGVLRHVRSTDGHGFTLIEVLVVITLMGICVVAVLSGMRATISATVIDRSHAVAFEWLQAASDEIYQADRVSCAPDPSDPSEPFGRDAAILEYDTAAGLAAVPPVWTGTTAKIEVTNVEYLGRSSVDADFEWRPSFCFEGVGTEYATSPLYTQRVTIQVTGPDGTMVQTLEMVKSE